MVSMLKDFDTAGDVIILAIQHQLMATIPLLESIHTRIATVRLLSAAILCVHEANLVQRQLYTAFKVGRQVWIDDGASKRRQALVDLYDRVVGERSKRFVSEDSEVWSKQRTLYWTLLLGNQCLVWLDEPANRQLLFFVMLESEGRYVFAVWVKGVFLPVMRRSHGGTVTDGHKVREGIQLPLPN